MKKKLGNDEIDEIIIDSIHALVSELERKYGVSIQLNIDSIATHGKKRR